MNPIKFFLAVTAVVFLTSGAPASAAEIRQDLLGDAAPADAAARSVTIRPDTRYVHVEGGEIIRFIVGDKTFGWNFNGPLTVSSYDLRRVAPEGVLDHEVRVIIAPNPRYMGP